MSPLVPVLEVSDLRTDIRARRSTVHVIDGVSFVVDTGETLGIVGESGSGKTMTALSIMRLLPAGGRIVGGRIVLGGRDLVALNEREMSAVRGNDVGVIFQDPTTSLNPTMTIGRQISESVRIHRGADRDEAHERAVEVLGLVGMPSPARRALDYPHQLSGGMRQRAMIAMALANEPKLLIADEPTTALDATVQKQILELLAELKARLSMAMILVTHDLGVIAGHADKVAVMYGGRIVEYTTAGRLYRNPRHPYTEALFRALPERAERTGAALYSIPGLPPDLTEPPTGCRFADRCTYAQDRCRHEDPLLTGELKEHSYACFFPVGARERTPAVIPDTLSWQQASWATLASDDDDPMLVVRGLTKEYPVTNGALLRRRVGAVSAVAGVSFTVKRGETFGLVGESGCGKSTVGRLIAGLEQPDTGTIEFDGRALSAGRRGRDAARIQLMFQDSYAAMNPRMRTSSILREPLDIQGYATRVARVARVQELLHAVGLPSSSSQRFPHEFSGGQLQRVGLARAMALKPALIVADEPMSALDVSIQAQVLNLMRDLQRDTTVSYVLISHNLSVVRYLSDQVAVMYLGKIVEIGPAESVCSRPVHHYTRGLLDAVAVVDPHGTAPPPVAGVKGEPPSAIDPPSGCRFRTRCPAARDLCAHQEPPLRDFGGGHQAACHFPLREPVNDLVAGVGHVEQTDGSG